MKTQCPICKTTQDVPDAYAGQEVKCVECKSAIIPKTPKFVINNIKQATPNPPQVEYPHQDPGFYLRAFGVLLSFAGGLWLFGNVTQVKELQEPLLLFVGGLILCGLSTIANLLAKLIPPKIKENPDHKKK